MNIRSGRASGSAFAVASTDSTVSEADSVLRRMSITEPTAPAWPMTFSRSSVERLTNRLSRTRSWWRRKSASSNGPRDTRWQPSIRPV